eukprot:TRINITY_DN14533_c0_g1_i1.p1 TRINITY_DN14533_c0_g1~~TRINITY_DN14533_c0_g1_i1.p1  ORF type:complete len:410 (+),score=91.99 TRINITY_DN14533_c0_g1_i1:108-1232(+)
MSTDAPPKKRRLRQGQLEAICASTCADPIAGGPLPPLPTSSSASSSSSSSSSTLVNPSTTSSLAAYWSSRGWKAYEDEGYTKSVRQVLVRHGSGPPLAYPSDQVWRLAAPVEVTEETPMLQVNVRSLLVAEPGYLLMSLDYSQIEVRLMAHFSGDPRFVEILHRGGDVFRHVAAGWLQKSESEVTAEERSGAKRICYGLIYGMGAGRLATDLGISKNQAMEFQASFMREFSGIANWVSSCQQQARQCGYVETLNGRRRFLPELAARSHTTRAHAERQAVNTSCQASAADLVKGAMVSIHRRLKEMRSHGPDGHCRMAGRLLLQIHDELLLEVEESRLHEVREMVIGEMIKAGNHLSVPLQVKWRVGPSWGSLES